MQQGYPQQGYQQGPPPKSGMPTWVKVLLILGVLGMCGVGGCIVCVGLGAKKVADTIETQAASAKAADEAAKAAATKVDIRALVDEYKNNEVRADEAYKGKYVASGGRVRDISKDFTDAMIVMVEPLDAKPFEHPVVACYPPEKDKATAASLNKGSLIVFKGRVDGKIVTNIIVRECELTLTKKGTAPVPAATPAKKK
jgi:hypothetical protein